MVVSPKGDPLPSYWPGQPVVPSNQPLATKPVGGYFIFLHTEDITRNDQHLLAQQIKNICRSENAPYEKVLFFKDRYGNR